MTLGGRLSGERRGALAATLGLGVLGGSAYVFLVVAGNVLGDERYAPLGALWILVFLLGPAFLYPVEQELSRAVAQRRARGEGIRPVVRRAALLTAGVTSGLLVLAAACSSLLADELFDGDVLLLVGLAASLVSYALAYVARGVFAGSGRLGRYGVLLAGEGLWRLAGAAVLAVVGVRTAGPYGVLVGIGPLLAVATVARGAGGLLDDGPPAPWRELTVSLGHLVAAATFAQVLINGAPLIVKYGADAGDQALAGAFAKAVVLSRIPLFLFQAVQAVMLPRLTHMATVGRHGDFRRAFAMAMSLVAGLGVVGTAGAYLFGDHLLAAFGSDFGLPRRDITLLAAGNAAFLLAMTVAQALVAVRGHVATAYGWLCGVAAFVAITALGPGATVPRVEWAQLAGGAIATLVMLALLARRLRLVAATADDLVEALDATHEMVEL